MVHCALTKPTITVGRGPENDLKIDGSFEGWQTVSHRHAVLEYDGQRAVVRDQNSTNGVYVNDRRTGTNLLRDGWKIKFGAVEFIFRENRGGGVS